jgi:prepilin-type N-terminal cleavage/methylation domain-containing protein
VVRRRSLRGFTLLEIVISMAVFGVFLMIAFTLTSEMRGWESRMPVNFMKHPQVMSVMTRLRRDVLDLQVPPSGNIYIEEHDGYVNGKQVLIIETLLPTGVQKIVWDFREPGTAKRIAYNVGNASDPWIARGLPEGFDVDVKSKKFPGRPYAVRIVVTDGNGKIAIDQILQPRTHN